MNSSKKNQLSPDPGEFLNYIFGRISEIVEQKLDEKLTSLKFEEDEDSNLYISASEVTKLFSPRISRQTIANYCRSGLLKKYKFGSKSLYKKSEILEAVKNVKRYGRQNLVTVEK